MNAMARRLTALCSLCLLPACDSRSGSVSTEQTERPSGAWPAIDPLYLETVYDSVSTREEAGFWERMPVEEITLESSGCYGVCPSYVVTLRRGGEASFQGRDFVDDLEGLHEGEVHVSDFARICLLLERLRFDDMDASYTAPWTDDNTMTMTVRYVARDTPVVVHDYGRQAPPEFYALTLAVEEVVRTIDWKKAGER